MKNGPERFREAGFALVVTLTLMILLTVVAVGLLTLSSISLRSTSQGAAQAAARSNARFALMLAIGELQKALGADQRISANASSVHAAALQPNVLGAWDSLGWQGPSGTAPLPAGKAEKFRGWLLSTKDLASARDFTFPTAAPGTDPKESIWLANPATTGTIAPNDTTLKAERIPVTVGNANGGIAWIVSDNSTKAAINIKNADSPLLAENIANRTAATAPRPSVLNAVFDKITEPANIISMQTAVIAIDPANKQEVNARAQSLTNRSLGLLTNPVSGGLKTDLTPLFEGSTNLISALGSSGPYFPPIGAAPGDGAPSWNFLRSHYQFYRRVSGLSAGKPRFKFASSDLSTTTVGIQPKPAKELLLPVIAKLQIVFSLVSHYSHITRPDDDRVGSLNRVGDPLGNTNHAVPHLVYDPVVTLYNPYDVELELSQLRIRISDPPVGFQFQKHDRQKGTHPWFRSEFANGEFQGLARFQIDKEHDVDARKTFTLYLRGKNPAGSPGGSVVLLPGEVKVFSPWVEKNWTWGFETKDQLNPRSFFDWNVGNNLGNEDRRTSNKKGVETIPGLDFRAGLQADHLSYLSGRPSDSIYPWEVPPLGGGWVSLKLTDEVTVNAKPQRCVADANLPDFRVDILAGKVNDADSDILRTYEFRLGDVAAEMSTTSSPSKTISRKFLNSDILQKPDDGSPGGKSPFAIFTMSAKTTKDARDDSKAWAFNNMVTEGGSHDSRKIGNAAQSYDLRLQEIQDFTTFPGVEYDDANQRGFFGAIANASLGVSIVPMYRVPLTPAASLGDWIASNLVTSSQLPRVNYPLGNSFAHPLIPSDQILTTSPMDSGGNLLDHTYLMNAALWDNYFFSTATNYTAAAFSPNSRPKAEVLDDFFKGKKPMLNSRLVPNPSAGADAATEYAGKSDLDFSRQFAKVAMVQGAFNINSDSIDAWRAVLSSLRGASVRAYANRTYEVKDKTAFVRNGLPIASAAEDANPDNSVNALGQIRWAGYRTLTDKQIENLATLIVAEIRARGSEDKAPSLCLADFINRRLGSISDLHALKGILQTAIDKSDINNAFHTLDSNTITGSLLAANRITGVTNTSALDGKTADGAAPMLTQGDLLAGLAPIITARGDTFIIRSYGESRTANGTTVVARAWCEATIQRMPEYVDPTNAPEALPKDLTPTNQIFGRRFIITSFRWLDSSEI